MAMSEPKKPSIAQVLKLVDRLTPEEQEELRQTFLGKITLIPETSDKKYVSTSKPIWEQIEELTKEIPSDCFKELPIDGASHHDDYLYK